MLSLSMSLGINVGQQDGKTAEHMFLVMFEVSCSECNIKPIIENYSLLSITH